MQTITTIGLDIAKSVFQVHGVDGAGQVVIRRQLKRRSVLAFFHKLPPCLVGIEACASAHHWSRELQAPEAPGGRPEDHVAPVAVLEPQGVQVVREGHERGVVGHGDEVLALHLDGDRVLGDERLHPVGERALVVAHQLLHDGEPRLQHAEALEGPLVVVRVLEDVPDERACSVSRQRHTVIASERGWDTSLL